MTEPKTTIAVYFDCLRRFTTNVVFVVGSLVFFSLQVPNETIAAEDKKDRNESDVLTFLISPHDDVVEAMMLHLSNELSDDSSRRILTSLGHGSWQSVLDLLTLNQIDLAAVQLDHLEYAREFRLVPEMDQKIVPIAVFGNAGIHVVAQRNIKKVSDLQGKKVGFGTSEGGLLTAAALFERLGVVVEAVELPFEQALTALRANELDAAVFIGGVPIRELQLIEWEALLHLVPIIDVGEPYSQIELTDRDYPGLMVFGEHLRIASIPVILAAYRWPKGHPQHALVNEFVRDFRDNLAVWKVRGASQRLWRNATAAKLPGWNRW